MTFFFLARPHSTPAPSTTLSSAIDDDCHDLSSRSSTSLNNKPLLPTTIGGNMAIDGGNKSSSKSLLNVLIDFEKLLEKRELFLSEERPLPIATKNNKQIQDISTELRHHMLLRPSQRHDKHDHPSEPMSD